MKQRQSATQTNTEGHALRAFNRRSTMLISSPAGMLRALARMKIVARAGPFSARSRALI